MIEKLFKLYPFWKGRGALANSGLMRPDKDGTRLVSLGKGLNIFVTDHDYISRMVRFFGDFDPCLTRLIRTLVATGDAVVDIGANLGVVTLPAAKWVGESGLVCAFEPQPRVSRLLRDSIAENALSNIRVYTIALSQFNGSGRVESNPSSLGTACLNPESPTFALETCDVRTLDSMELPIDERPLRLVKIDVEGHEANVLRGASEFLRRYRPAYILFESHAARGAFEEREEVRLLREFGYKIFAVRRTLLLRPKLVEMGDSVDGAGACSEYLAKKQ